MADLVLPGLRRYQPKDLQSIFGYDSLARTLVEVELAVLYTLGELRIIPRSDMALLTPEIESKLLSITTTEMDRVERTDTPEYGKKTGHDIRALVRVMQHFLPAPLRRWVHVPLTSYDVIDTARSLQFVRAHKEVVRQKANKVIACLQEQALRFADEVQIGRTHGQHALPTTVGFWLSTVLSRVLFNIDKVNWFAEGLVGKISGAVGAYNAQQALGLYRNKSGSLLTFEQMVLARLGLSPADISTQILPSEPLAYYLFACVALSASLGQFGRDCRHLMRTEIGELAEPFEAGQIGSSTMAHKRNPLNFENTEGMYIKNKNEFGNVLDTVISEHQRDLVGSSVARDFPVIIVNLTYQLDTLLRPDKNGTPFISRITVDREACQRNLKMQGDLILAEPFYLMLQMHGYEGDAHGLINDKAVPMVGRDVPTLYAAVEKLAEESPELADAWDSIPFDTRELFRNPAHYTGRARDKTLETCARAEEYLKNG